jgi:hypothetical protein
LLTPSQLELIPIGTQLSCIDRLNYVKGKDYLDNDTRFGYTAYGIIDPFNTLDKELLTILLLAM